MRSASFSIPRSSGTVAIPPWDARTASRRSASCARRAPGSPRPRWSTLIDAGDKVVVILRRTAGDGDSTELVANLTTFRDGKVVEMVHYPNPDDARAAAGV